MHDLTDNHNLLRASIAAQMLGVSRNTVLNMCNRGSFPNAFRLMREWRIPVSDVEAITQAQPKTKGNATKSSPPAMSS